MLLIFCTGLISAILFGILPVLQTAAAVLKYQKESIQILRDERMEDNVKQEMLLSNAFHIFTLTMKLAFFIILATIPFFILIYLGDWILKSSFFADSLISFQGLAVSCFSFLTYYFIRKMYVKFRL
jgi:hypothetical protein